VTTGAATRDESCRNFRLGDNRASAQICEPLRLFCSASSPVTFVNRRESGGSGLPVTIEQLGIFGMRVSRGCGLGRERSCTTGRRGGVALVIGTGHMLVQGMTCCEGT
jgi:hypothetical protein